MLDVQQKELGNSKIRNKYRIIIALALIFVLMLVLIFMIPFVKYSVYIKAERIVACVGDSITYGYGINMQKYYSYPGQLQYKLKTEYSVKNFGVNGATASINTNNPYAKTSEYKDSINCNPTIVLIMLGTNDSKSYNYSSKKVFKEDYKCIVEDYKSLSSVNRVYLLLPINAYDNVFDIDNNRIQSEIRDAICEVMEGGKEALEKRYYRIFKALQ